ncbi:MAG: oligosaccharide flippase family protein [Erysipelotrichaceae bacterium]|nr:oligosaccharide flippase family protein [Erysipelotrichaceae bacterium]
MSETRKKQSIIVGALTGTAGIFFTKALGLLYASPFQAMVGNEMIFYTSTYQIYEFLLTISLSGIPFAIATLVAKYLAKEDYKTALLVRKLSGYLLGCFGITIFVLVVLSSGTIAQYLGAGRDAIYIQKYQTSIILISFAVIAVPILSMFRGFYQGMKEMKAYAFSQVLEQFVRIVFLLGMGALMIYVFHKEQIWAVYFAIVSTSISAVAAIIYFQFFDQKHLTEMQQLSKKQEKEAQNTKDLLKEILYFAIPYFLISVIGNCSGMINLMFVNRSLQSFGYTAQQADIIYSIMNFNSYKLVSIPQILGPGFAIAIIPHITTALTLHDFDAIGVNIKKVYTSCSYIIYPIILLMILYAKEIYYVMYGAENLAYGADVLRWNLLVTCVWILMTLSSNILMALKLKRFNLIWNIFDVVMMLIFIGPVVSHFAYQGMYVFYIVLYTLFVLLATYLIKRNFNVAFKPIVRTITKSLFCLTGIVVVYFLFSILKIDWINYGRIVTMFGVGFICCMALVVYAVMSYWLKLPQEIFNFDLQKVKGMLKRS